LVREDPNYEVRAFTGNICSKEDVIKNLRGIDTLVNFAALTYLPPSWSSAKAYTNVNYEGVLNFLTNHEMFSRFVQISTSHVYGNQKELPVKLTARPLPQDPYSIAKFAAEEAVRAYSERYNFEALVIRPFNCFGPRQSGHFVIPHFIKQALSSRLIVVRGDTAREFLYVKDNVKAIKALVDSRHRGLIHICKGEPYRISAVAKMILDATQDLEKQVEGKVEVMGSDRPHDIQTLYGDPEPFRKALPEHKWTPMPEAIGETVSWYREH
jgi:dTDP-glucose 4,6-dehydratase